MQLHEAEEIIKSPNKINVLYNGFPVWIEEIDNNSQTAQVRSLQTREILGVYLKDLVNTKEIVGKINQ